MIPNVFFKLSASMDSLALGTGSIQKRLHNAVSNLIVLREEDFALNTWKALFCKIIELSNYEQILSDEGTLNENIAVMSDDDSVKIATMISELHGLIESDYRYAIEEDLIARGGNPNRISL